MFKFFKKKAKSLESLIDSKKILDAKEGIVPQMFPKAKIKPFTMSGSYITTSTDGITWTGVDQFQQFPTEIKEEKQEEKQEEKLGFNFIEELEKL